MPVDRRHTYEVMRRVRKMEEEARARDMVAAHVRVTEGQRVRAALEQTRTEALEQAAERLASPEIDASDMRAYYQYERHLARAIDVQDAENRKLEKTLREERAKLHEAAVRRRVAERLETREKERAAQEAARQEGKRLDEAAIVRALLSARKGDGP